MKNLVCISMFLLAVLPFGAIAQNEDTNDLNEQLKIVQEQMTQMLENFGNIQDQSAFFFSDSLEINDFDDFRALPMDSLLQGFSFLMPGVEMDSIWTKGFGSQNEFFGEGFEEQLNQMFRSFEDLDPSYFEGMEDLMKELEKNGIRPDDLQKITPGQKKKKVYKL